MDLPVEDLQFDFYGQTEPFGLGDELFLPSQSNFHELVNSSLGEYQFNVDTSVSSQTWEFSVSAQIQPVVEQTDEPTINPTTNHAVVATSLPRKSKKINVKSEANVEPTVSMTVMVGRNQSGRGRKRKILSKPITGTGEKPVNPHSIVEKRYRMSINDKLNELKRKLAKDRPSISKSAIINLACKTIVDYQEMNKDLMEENAEMRRLLVNIPPVKIEAEQEECTSQEITQSASLDSAPKSSPTSPSVEQPDSENRMLLLSFDSKNIFC